MFWQYFFDCLEIKFIDEAAVDSLINLFPFSNSLCILFNIRAFYAQRNSARRPSQTFSESLEHCARATSSSDVWNSIQNVPIIDLAVRKKLSGKFSRLIMIVALAIKKAQEYSV